MYFRRYGSLKSPKKWGKKKVHVSMTLQSVCLLFWYPALSTLLYLYHVLLYIIYTFGKHHFTRARSKAFKKLHLLIQFALFYLFSEVFIQHQGNWIIFFMDQKYYWENITIKNVCPVFPRTEYPSRKCYFCHCPKLIQ